jgi:WD40 repeat protein
VWDLNASRQVARFPWVSGKGRSLRLSPDETLLVGVAPEARRLTVWDLNQLKEIGTLPKSEGADPTAYQEAWNFTDFSRDGRRIASGNWNGTIEVWDLDRMERIAYWPAHKEPVRVGFLPDGKRLVTVCQDATAKLWDIESGRELKSFARALNNFQCVAVAPGGDRIAGETSPARVNLWNPATGQEVAELRMDERMNENVNDLQFLPPDGSVLAICTDSMARVWRAPSWEEIKKAEAKKQKETAKR